MIKYIAPFLIAASLNAADWTTADTARQTACVSLLAADWCQTRQIVKTPGMYETNPLIGRHPSLNRVNTYFISAIVGHTLLSYNLTPKNRKRFQYATIGLEAAVVGRNYHIGLNAKW